MALSTYGWNALGHQLIAQVAYDNLTPKARRVYDEYCRSFSLSSRRNGFVMAASWLDFIRSKDIHRFDALHYIDIPFSKDDSPLPPIAEINALQGIYQAISVLNSEKTLISEKKLNLRILIHVVGDIHQPLHTVTQVSRRLPRGDLGGNLFPLMNNSIATNLHEYWDKGGGVLIGQNKLYQVRSKAHQLEKKWPCTLANVQKKPEQWVNESHILALTQAYTISPGSTLSKYYQLNTQKISQRQIVFAGCRLAILLNHNKSLH